MFAFRSGRGRGSEGLPQKCRVHAALAIAAGWVLYDLGVNLPSHNELNQLLAHAELGIDAEQHLRARPLARRTATQDMPPQDIQVTARTSGLRSAHTE